MNDDFAPIEQVVDQGIADWLAERAANSRNPAEFQTRINHYQAKYSHLPEATVKPTVVVATVDTSKPARPGCLWVLLRFVLRGR
jgi:hypothetical protein